MDIVELDGEEWFNSLVNDLIPATNMKKNCGDCLTQEVELNSRENNKEENMSMLKKLIKLFSEGEVTLASLDTTELGTLTADAFEIGNIVYDANLQPVVDTEFSAEGKVYSTDATGTIVEISDVAEETTDQLEEAPVLAEDVAPEVATNVEETTTAIVDEVAKPVEDVDVEALKALVAQLQADLEKLTVQQEAVLMENVELKSMAASTKLKAEVKGQSPITMKTKEVSTDSTLEALSRITKKNNK